MGRRKLFIKTDLSTPQVEYDLDRDGKVTLLPQAFPPSITVVKFGLNAVAARNFDFSVAVGMAVTCHPPHRSVRAELPHTAPALGFDAETGHGIRMHG